MIITLDNYDELKWNKFALELKINNIYNLLQYYLNSINTLKIKDKIFNEPDSLMYKELVDKYFRILYRLTNQFEYNFWLDKFIEKHSYNLILQTNYNMLKECKVKKVQNVSNKSKIKKRGWIRHNTEDMFENKITYIYENLSTGESFESTDPNLLQELKSRKKKTINITKDFKFQF